MVAKMLGKKSSTGEGRVIKTQYAGADIRIPLLYPPRFSAIYVRAFIDAEGELWRVFMFIEIQITLSLCPAGIAPHVRFAHASFILTSLGLISQNIDVQR